MFIQRPYSSAFQVAGCGNAKWRFFRNTPRILGLAMVATLVLVVSNPAGAALIILDDPGDMATINNVRFQIPSTAIGNIPSGQHSFLRFNDDNDSDSIQSGFNTTAAGPFTPVHDDITYMRGLKTSELPTVKIAGVDYLEFVFSLQQQGGDKGDPIDFTKIYLAGSSTPAVSDYGTLTAFKIIDDPNTDSIRLKPNYPGTNADLQMYVRKDNSVFLSTYLVMFNYTTGGNGGPDEWGHFGTLDGGSNGGAIPEPASITLWGFLATCALGARWRLRRKAA